MEQVLLENSMNNDENHMISKDADRINPPQLSEIPFNIGDLLYEGQDIMVQVSKEPMGNNQLICAGGTESRYSCPM